MNFYLLQLVGKWISLITLSILSLFNFEIEQKDYTMVNDNSQKKINVVTTVVEHQTIRQYNNSLPNNVTNVLVEGKDGISFTDESGNEIVLEEPVDEVLEVGSGSYGVYNGIMTAYGPDCYGCSKVGNVACRTKAGNKHSLINDGVYYNDEAYGQVRIMAAALSVFPCGTIIEVKNSNLGDFMGIVLDTGYDMRRHLSEGIYHFDVAFPSESDEQVPKVTNMSGNVIYNVQRWGW